MGIASDRATSDPSEERLLGAWLAVARTASALIVAFALAVFVASLPVAFVQMHVTCTDVCLGSQLTLAQAHSLSRLGISLGAYATFELVFTLATSLVWFGIAAVVFWRQSNSFVPLLVAVQLVTQGATAEANAFFGTTSVWDYPASLLVVLNGILLFLFLALFPSGRLVPRWMGWVLIPACGATAAQLIPGAPPALQSVFLLMLVVLIAAQIYRYRVVSSSLRRQQTKWAIFGIAISLAVQIGLLIPLAFVPDLSAPASLYSLVAGTIAGVALTLGPIGFMFGVLRFRLYDIDLIINRTLVYGSLTAILAAVYFGAVVGLQQVVRAFAGAEAAKEPVIVVFSTLLIAALFSPLRHRLQRGIDRRFYREKYDAARTLERFAASLRSDLDLAELQAHLLGVVEETLQPTHVSLWLRRESREREVAP